MFSSWIYLHTELVCLKQFFLKKSFPENFINKFFKRFMDNLRLIKGTTLTIEINPFVLVLPYLCPISSQTITTLMRSLRNILNCCKMQIVFKNKIRLSDKSHYKDRFPKILLLLLFISFSVDSAMSPIMVNMLDT